MKRWILICGVIAVIVYMAYDVVYGDRRICKFPTRPTLTLDTVRFGKFEETIPFHVKVLRDSINHGPTFVAEIDQLYLSRIKKELFASHFCNDEDVAFQVTEVDPILHNGRFNIRLAPVNSDTVDIRNDSQLRMRLKLSDPINATMLQVGGFYRDSGGKYVYVVLPDKKLVKRSIVIGKKNPDYFQVLAGLTAGDVVVTSPYDIFKNYDHVTIDDLKALYEHF